MINVNEYFNGNVMSLGTSNNDGKATVGVIAPGEYEFGTSSIEIMNVVWGTLEAKLPGEGVFKAYPKGSSFRIEKGEKFQVRSTENVAYLCQYL